MKSMPREWIPNGREPNTPFFPNIPEEGDFQRDEADIQNPNTKFKLWWVFPGKAQDNKGAKNGETTLIPKGLKVSRIYQVEGKHTKKSTISEEKSRVKAEWCSKN